MFRSVYNIKRFSLELAMTGTSRAGTGTYMQAIGFVEENVKVSVETFADDSARMIGMHHCS